MRISNEEISESIAFGLLCKGGPSRPAVNQPPSGQVWTQYYFAGGQRIAMRIRDGSRNEVYYLLIDHLGSTALTVGETGMVLGETRYKAWVSRKEGEPYAPSLIPNKGHGIPTRLRVLD